MVWVVANGRKALLELRSQVLEHCFSGAWREIVTTFNAAAESMSLESCHGAGGLSARMIRPAGMIAYSPGPR